MVSRPNTIYEQITKDIMDGFLLVKQQRGRDKKMEREFREFCNREANLLQDQMIADKIPLTSLNQNIAIDRLKVMWRERVEAAEQIPESSLNFEKGVHIGGDW
jgi:hypothetical protein